MSRAHALPSSVRTVAATTILVALFSARSWAQAPTAEQLAAAMDIPPGSIVSVQLVQTPNDLSRHVASQWGSAIAPTAGGTFTALSTGVARTPSEPGYQSLSTVFGIAGWVDVPVPDVPGCPAAGAPYDVTELRIELRVPLNVTAFTFDHNYLSTDYPESVCMPFGDVFIAHLESTGFTGNVAFDGFGNPITSNAVLFTATFDNQPELIAGTGFEDSFSSFGGGASLWNSSMAPVTPGEVIVLRLFLFDAGDSIFDSQILLDNFRWNQPPRANIAPTVDAGPDRQIASALNGLAAVTLTGSATDADGDQVALSWSGAFGTIAGGTLALTLPIGVHTLTLTGDDGWGGIASDSVVVTVIDGAAVLQSSVQGHEARIASLEQQVAALQQALAVLQAQVNAMAGSRPPFGPPASAPPPTAPGQIKQGQ